MYFELWLPIFIEFKMHWSVSSWIRGVRYCM